MIIVIGHMLSDWNQGTLCYKVDVVMTESGSLLHAAMVIKKCSGIEGKRMIVNISPNYHSASLQ